MRVHWIDRINHVKWLLIVVIVGILVGIAIATLLVSCVGMLNPKLL